MFATKKLALAAACVALALGPTIVSAEPQSSHLRIHVREHAVKAVEASSSGASADLGAAGAGGSTEDDSDSSDDSDEGKGPAGSSGSAATSFEAGNGNSMMVDPVPTTAPPADDDSDDSGEADEPVVDVVVDVVVDPTNAPVCAGKDEYPVSVEYAEGVYCAKGKVCVADQADGVCPGPQQGLPFGSRCDKVLSGVYGCTMNSKPSAAPGDGAEASGSSDDSDDSEDATSPVGSADFCPGDDEFEMSVEGAPGVYCIKGQACVGDIADGVCPGPQKGLALGSYCGIVKSGVYGCKMNTQPADKRHKKAQSPKKKAKHARKRQAKMKAKARVRGHGSRKKAAKHDARASTKSKGAKASGTKTTTKVRRHGAAAQH